MIQDLIRFSVTPFTSVQKCTVCLPRYTSDEQVTQDKLQELPDAIKTVTNELIRLRERL